MLLIIAHRGDTAAGGLVQRWVAYGAHLVSCDDLSNAGWCHYLSDLGASTAVIGGRMVGITQITAVVTLDWV